MTYTRQLRENFVYSMLCVPLKKKKEVSRTPTHVHRPPYFSASDSRLVLAFLRLSLVQTDMQTVSVIFDVFGLTF